MNTRFRIAAPLLALIVALTACDAAQPQPPVTSPLTQPTTDQKHVVEAKRESVSPLESPLKISMAIPTQDPTLGTVTGVLFHKGQPVSGFLVYLAATTKDSSGKDTAVSMDRINSPRAFTGPDGAFSFPNVPPGKYGLVVDKIQTSFLLSKPDGTGDLLIEVTGTAAVDFGKLDYDDSAVAVFR